MKREYVYTVLFTFVVSAFLTAILAGANAFFLPRIERNEELAERRAILYVLNVPFSDDAEVERLFAESISEQQVGDLNVFAKSDDSGAVSGYAVPFQGAGLWGTIRGYMGLTADLSELLGIEFTEQNETPGLGSRIDEAWYKEQFRGIPLIDGAAVLTDEDGDLVIDAITGATSTSNAVINIVRNSTASILSRLEGAL